MHQRFHLALLINHAARDELKNMKMKPVILLIFLFCGSTAFAQVETNKVSVGDSLYQSNIKKTRLYGVYIPKDISDALAELDKLSTEDAKIKLQKAEETTIAKKLRFGIGRWMEYNWNLQEGSRFSHHLREKGLLYPDDMVEVMIILYYRHVKNAPLDEEKLIREKVDARKAILDIEKDKNTIKILDKKK